MLRNLPPHYSTADTDAHVRRSFQGVVDIVHIKCVWSAFVRFQNRTQAMAAYTVQRHDSSNHICADLATSMTRTFQSDTFHECIIPGLGPTRIDFVVQEAAPTIVMPIWVDCSLYAPEEDPLCFSAETWTDGLRDETLFGCFDESLLDLGLFHFSDPLTSLGIV
jgi:hypothetical protein